MHRSATRRPGASAADAADRAWCWITNIVLDRLVVIARENAKTLTDRDRGV